MLNAKKLLANDSSMYACRLGCVPRSGQNQEHTKSQCPSDERQQCKDEQYTRYRRASTSLIVNCTSKTSTNVGENTAETDQVFSGRYMRKSFWNTSTKSSECAGLWNCNSLIFLTSNSLSSSDKDLLPIEGLEPHRPFACTIRRPDPNPDITDAYFHYNGSDLDVEALKKPNCGDKACKF
jgi:hypothetical protein